MSDKVYEIVTERIVKALEAGVVPWQCPWDRTEVPRNLVTKREYHGVNRMLLGPMTSGYARPYWCTFKQARDAGGSVKKGEHGALVVFWKRLLKKGQNEADPDAEFVYFLRYTVAFNVAQIDGLEHLVPEQKKRNGGKKARHAAAEALAEAYFHRKGAPGLKKDSGVAAYNWLLDEVRVPPVEAFYTVEAYYSAMFHEAVHSTGHKDRLDRFGKEPGLTGYSKEELVAEMGAAFLMADAGLGSDKVLKDSAAYIDGWRKYIQGAGPREVLSAASKAQEASEYIHGKPASEENGA